MSVYKGFGDGRGWGKRDESADGVESIPIYTCDRNKENGPHNRT